LVFAKRLEHQTHRQRKPEGEVNEIPFPRTADYRLDPQRCE
jgi:hypothetical protein